MNANLAQIEDEYARLRARLGRLGWISHGYVQDRGPGAGGPCYQWTRKVKAKTVSVALSQEQYEALKEAIDTWHQTQEILQRMQALSRHVIFEMLPNPSRRKRLGNRVLALQRRFEGFPFFQLFHSAFPVGEVSLVIAAGRVLHQYKNVADLTFGLWKAALN
jgi:hypothetical protein